MSFVIADLALPPNPDFSYNPPMPDAVTVPAVVEGKRYDITIRKGLLGDVGAILSTLSSAKKAAIVTDSNVGPQYLAPVVESLRESGINPIVATIPAGEDHKTLAQIGPVYDVLLSAKIER